MNLFPSKLYLEGSDKMKQMVGIENKLTEYIRNVAVYYRKSRGELEKDLENHKFVLREICERYKWNYIEYEEIGTGDSIAARNEIKKLLKDVREELFDAVLIYDYDRLGRGNATDQDTIINTMRQTDTLIVQANPFQILNPNDERDEETMEFKGFLARREYKLITKRLSTGRKIRARQGYWSITFAPYGYEIDEETKKLKIIEEQKNTIINIVDWYLDGKSFADIAWQLNVNKIPSPSNGKWNEGAIGYILKNEVYLGWVVSNKTSRKKLVSETNEVSYKVEKNPKDEWIIVKGIHEPIISVEQHHKIKDMMRQKTSHRSGSGVNPFSGMVKCYKCGSTMTMQKVTDDHIAVKNCSSCDNKGGDTNLISTLINHQIISVRKLLLDKQSNIKQDTFVRDILQQISDLETQLEKNQIAMEKIEEMYEEGDYTKEKYLKKKEKRVKQISEIEEELTYLKRKSNNFSSVGNEERIRIIDKFIRNIETVEDRKILHENYKSIIHSIIWQRTTNDEVRIKVNFL